MIWYFRDVWVLLFLGSDTGQNLHATHIQMRKWRKYEYEEMENFCDEIEQSIEAWLKRCEEVLVSIDIIDIVMVTIVIICFQWVDNRNFVLLKSWILHAFTSQCNCNVSQYCSLLYSSPMNAMYYLSEYFTCISADIPAALCVTTLRLYTAI